MSGNSASKTLYLTGDWRMSSMPSFALDIRKHCKDCACSILRMRRTSSSVNLHSVDSHFTMCSLLAYNLFLNLRSCNLQTNLEIITCANLKEIELKNWANFRSDIKTNVLLGLLLR